MTSKQSKISPINKYLEGTELLDHDVLGVYIRLIDYMWASRSKLPNDDEKIAHFLRITRKKWKNYKEILQDYFIFADLSFTHKLVKAEYNKQVGIQRQNSLNASLRWDKLSKKSKQKISPSETSSPSSTNA